MDEHDDVLSIELLGECETVENNRTIFASEHRVPGRGFATGMAIVPNVGVEVVYQSFRMNMAPFKVVIPFAAIKAIKIRIPDAVAPARMVAQQPQARVPVEPVFRGGNAVGSGPGATEAPVTAQTVVRPNTGTSNEPTPLPAGGDPNVGRTSVMPTGLNPPKGFTRHPA